MRAGRLRYRAVVYSLEGEPPALALEGAIWCAVREAKPGAVQAGLRAASPCEITTRTTTLVFPGRFIKRAGRTWVVDATTGDERKQIHTATELIGEAGTYTPAAGGSYSVRVFLALNTPYIGDEAVTAYHHRIDVSKSELTVEPKRGDTLTVRGRTWTVTGMPDGGDDGMIMQLLVRT